jgi:hypothetical protein
MLANEITVAIFYDSMEGNVYMRERAGIMQMGYQRAR